MLGFDDVSFVKPLRSVLLLFQIRELTFSCRAKMNIWTTLHTIHTHQPNDSDSFSHAVEMTVQVYLSSVPRSVSIN